MTRMKIESRYTGRKIEHRQYVEKSVGVKDSLNELIEEIYKVKNKSAEEIKKHLELKQINRIFSI